MKSRYNFMKASIEEDSVDQNNYPDPLTLNYHEFELKEGVEAIELRDVDILQFWNLIHKKYGTAEYDDIVLELNNIPHKNFLNPGDVIYIPSVRDIERSFIK